MKIKQLILPVLAATLVASSCFRKPSTFYDEQGLTIIPQPAILATSTYSDIKRKQNIVATHQLTQEIELEQKDISDAVITTHVLRFDQQGRLNRVTKKQYHQGKQESYVQTGKSATFVYDTTNKRVLTEWFDQERHITNLDEEGNVASFYVLKQGDTAKLYELVRKEFGGQDRIICEYYESRDSTTTQTWKWEKNFLGQYTDNVAISTVTKQPGVPVKTKTVNYKDAGGPFGYWATSKTD